MRLTYTNLAPTFTRLGISNTLPGGETTILHNEIKRVLSNAVGWEYGTDQDILIVNTEGMASTELGRMIEYDPDW